VKLASEPLPACLPFSCLMKFSSSLFASPLFSQPYELLVPPARRTLGAQAPCCSDNHLNRPGVCCWGLSALLSRHSSLATRHFPCIFSSLQPLWRSWLSFSGFRPLFSATSSLFLQNTGGWGTLSLSLRNSALSAPLYPEPPKVRCPYPWTFPIVRSTSHPGPSHSTFNCQLSTIATSLPQC
jgi:hypothetical protein